MAESGKLTGQAVAPAHVAGAPPEDLVGAGVVGAAQLRHERHRDLAGGETGEPRRHPARKQLRHRLSPFNPAAGEQGADAYPYVLTTFRLTAHHTAGGMTRTVPYLAEIQPEMF